MMVAEPEACSLLEAIKEILKFSTEDRAAAPAKATYEPMLRNVFAVKSKDAN